MVINYYLILLSLSLFTIIDQSLLRVTDFPFYNYLHTHTHPHPTSQFRVVNKNKLSTLESKLWLAGWQTETKKVKNGLTRVGFEPTPLTRPGNLEVKLYDKVTLPWRLGPLGHLAIG